MKLVVLDIEDAMQVTFMEAFLRIGKFAGSDSRTFSAWLGRIAENNLCDGIRPHGESDICFAAAKSAGQGQGVRLHHPGLCGVGSGGANSVDPGIPDSLPVHGGLPPDGRLSPRGQGNVWDPHPLHRLASAGKRSRLAICHMEG